MAQGKLGAVAVAAAAWTLAYTVPASTVATANIRIVNRGNTATTLRGHPTGFIAHYPPGRLPGPPP